MELNKVSFYKPIVPALDSQAPLISKTSEQSFSKVLTEAIDEVNRLQQDKQVLQQKFITGELNDVHTLMIATEKASLGLQLTVQVRNKVLEAYQEMMRMQV